MAKEKEIFRDCYNLLKANLDNPMWATNISVKVQDLIHKKYAGDKQDQLLCAELISVIVNHLDRRGRCDKQ